MKLYHAEDEARAREELQTRVRHLWSWRIKKLTSLSFAIFLI